MSYLACDNTPDTSKVNQRTYAQMAAGCCGVVWIYNFWHGNSATLRQFLKEQIVGYSNKAMLMLTINNLMEPTIGPILREFGFNVIAGGANKQPARMNVVEHNNVLVYCKILNPLREIPTEDQKKGEEAFAKGFWNDNAPENKPRAFSG